MSIDMPKAGASSGFSRALSMGKKVASLGSGNPVQVAATAMSPGSPAGQLLAAGTQFMTGGVGGDKGANPMGDGKPGGMPSINGNPFSRRVRAIAGPEF